MNPVNPWNELLDGCGADFRSEHRISETWEGRQNLDHEADRKTLVKIFLSCVFFVCVFVHMGLTTINL